MKNKLNRAVALKYSNKDNSPKVIAKGEGIIATNIIEKAIDENITLYQDKELVDKLIELDIDHEIPEELYEAVAEIIFYVYSLDSEKRKMISE